MGTNETRAANSQIMIIVATATRLVTHRPYLRRVEEGEGWAKAKECTQECLHQFNMF